MLVVVVSPYVEDEQLFLSHPPVCGGRISFETKKKKKQTTKCKTYGREIAEWSTSFRVWTQLHSLRLKF